MYLPCIDLCVNKEFIRLLYDRRILVRIIQIKAFWAAQQASLWIFKIKKKIHYILFVKYSDLRTIDTLPNAYCVDRIGSGIIWSDEKYRYRFATHL